MKNTAIAVIGAHYGDEGKGLVVDRLVRDLAQPWVIRFNGGAQAGHTVSLLHGRRHIFSHFGAGTFAGAPTFLSRFFVSNPLLFLREAHELEASGVAPRIVVDPRSPLTTPYEVLLNRSAERARGNGRHGSCGVGFGETLERQERGLSITAADLNVPDVLRSRLTLLRTTYVPRRLADLGIPIDAELQADLADPEPVARFVELADAFRQRIEIAGIDACQGRPVVFEGAQGLLLDQSLGDFPHVTRSCTGLPNIVDLAGDLGLPAVEVFYAMRTYITRHGAGPLAGELDSAPYSEATDATNQPNPFQGHLRFAFADPALSVATIKRDLARSSRLTIIPSLAVTCLDQVAGPVSCRDGGGTREIDPDDFVGHIAGRIAARRVLQSHGPTAETARFSTVALRAAA
ncbi:adenylosuccinate synthetase [Reyranella sp.]|uniref:adenylosuccinate synthetase n=1 Tax=Reyranella sp. TaxID=1929291 RepID=UPI003BAC74AF